MLAIERDEGICIRRQQGKPFRSDFCIVLFHHEQSFESSGSGLGLRLVDAIKVIFNGLADYLGLVNKGNYILPFCTTPDAIGANGVELAEKLFKAIAV